MEGKQKTNKKVKQNIFERHDLPGIKGTIAHQEATLFDW